MCVVMYKKLRVNINILVYLVYLNIKRHVSILPLPYPVSNQYPACLGQYCQGEP